MSKIIIRKINGDEIRKEIPNKEEESPVELKKELYKGYELSSNPKFKYKHQEIYFEANGIPPKGWHIHHIDRNKLNNHIENLIAIPEEIHEFIHFRMRQENKTWTRLDVENELKAYQENKTNLESAYKELLIITKTIEKLQAQAKRWEIPEQETFSGQKYKPLPYKKAKLKKKKKTTYGSIISSDGLVACPNCQSTNTSIQMGQRRGKESFKCFCQKSGCRNVQFVRKTIIPNLLKIKLRGEFNES